MTPPRSTSLGVVIVLVTLGWLAVRGRASERDPMGITLPGHSSAYLHLSHWEGYRLTAYPDRNGTWSVGVGHSLGVRPRRMTYTAAEVQALFNHDLAIALATARECVERFDELPEQVRNVTLGLIWCCGPSGFRAWHGFILALRYRAWNGAAVELTRSRWWQEVSAERANAYLRILRSQT